MAISVARSKTKPVGRYITPGHEPPNGRGRPAPSVNVRTAVGSVPDPFPNEHEPHRRISVTINRRTDILEHELSHGLLSDAAYQIGRIAQTVFERGVHVSGGGQWRQGDRVDADYAHELAIVRHLEDAGKIGSYVGWMVRVLGMIDARIVRRVLGDRMSYADVAALQGKSGDRGDRKSVV